MKPNLIPSIGRDRRGNVAIIFALAVIPVMAALGVAVDLSNATRVRLALQDATDSAVLALGRDGLSVPPGQLQAVAKRYLDASYNYNDLAYAITKVTFNKSTVTAELNTSVNVPTVIMGMFGENYKFVPVTAHAVSKGAGFEIAMVLDNSGSMKDPAGSGGPKIDALKDGSKALVDVMFGSTSTSERVNISIVPFAASVNVGAANGAASWIDNTVSTEIQSEDFESPVNRNAVLAAMRSVSWGGCVMQRMAPYDLDDSSPASGDSLFVKWFAPDEPDKTSYSNNYLLDGGGDCTGDVDSMTDKVRQQRICKYNRTTPDLSAGKGPNFLCTTTPITPLNNTRLTLDASLNAMQANGNTNIVEGLLWGWRTLSPTAPFTEGKAYGNKSNRKVVILMTDGENYIGAAANRNVSKYTAFGFAEHGRIGNPATSDEATNRARVDVKTLTACGKVKEKGIAVYTIAFGAGAKGSAPMLKACATDPSYYYEPQNSSELRPVFLKIADSINRLRIAS